MVLTFGVVRKRTLNLWLTNTGRKLVRHRNLHYDDFSFNDFECKWQQRSWAINGEEWHVPHFCSIGEWACNITDMLDDARLDAFTFQDEMDKPFLYRYYTRYMLVILEMINDFVDMLVLINPNSGNKTQRKNSLSLRTNVNELTNFINSLCKHKADTRDGNHIHFHNHHLPIWFEDLGPNQSFQYPLSCCQAIQAHPDGILIPSLMVLTQVIIDGYKKLESCFVNDPTKFNTFTNKYGAPYTEPI